MPASPGRWLPRSTATTRRARSSRSPRCFSRPYFLNRVEVGTPLADDPDTRKYSPHEMASRLSYTLWGTTPDAELLAAADNGELQTEASVREHTQRLLADPLADGPLVAILARTPQRRSPHRRELPAGRQRGG